jgi:hypothetical protein
MATPPISFAALAKTAGNPAAGGYPYALKGTDLDKNFTFATADFDTADFFVTDGLPGSGTHVLGAVDGALQWIATEEC